jgi:lipoprotein-releasing system permease protein
VRSFELKVAFRHLLTGHGQTELTVGAVAVGVVLVVFLSSLINGLQVGLIDDVVGSIPHITVEASEPSPRPLSDIPGQGGLGGQVLTKIEQISSKRRKIERWRQTVASVSRLPSVSGVAPMAQGSGFIGRGAKKIGAVINGVVPEDQMGVISLESRIVEGDFLRVDQQNAAIGLEMARELGAGIDSRVRVTSAEGVTQTFRVACIFDLGLADANKSWVYIGLPAAQALLKLGRDITTINVRTHDMFRADQTASQIAGFSALKVTSWMEANKSFLDTLRAQNAAAVIIQAMTLMASAFGVASVMIVFVVQKARDIGILKSMGATSRQIQRIFMLEGLGVGVGGALLGSGLGTGLCYLAANILVPGETFGGKPASIVPMKWDIVYVVAASAVAVAMGLISSLVPARRAAKLNPVEAIRRGL